MNLPTYTFNALVVESTYSDETGDLFESVQTNDVSFVTDEAISSFSYLIDYDYDYGDGAEVAVAGDHGTLLAADLGDDDLSAFFVENSANIYAFVATLEWGAGNDTFMAVKAKTVSTGSLAAIR